MIYLFEDLLLLFDLHFPTFSPGARQTGEWNVHLFRKYATNRSETYYGTCKRILWPFKDSRYLPYLPMECSYISQTLAVFIHISASLTLGIQHIFKFKRRFSGSELRFTCNIAMR